MPGKPGNTRAVVFAADRLRVLCKKPGYPLKPKNINSCKSAISANYLRDLLVQNPERTISSKYIDS
jgi:hypothetical protein